MEPTTQDRTLSPKKMMTRTKVALWVLISPTALIIATFFLFAIVNIIFNPTMWLKADSDEMLAATPIFITIINVILFLIGVLGVVTWLPGIIAGIILLTIKK